MRTAPRDLQETTSRPPRTDTRGSAISSSEARSSTHRPPGAGGEDAGRAGRLVRPRQLVQTTTGSDSSEEDDTGPGVGSGIVRDRFFGRPSGPFPPRAADLVIRLRRSADQTTQGQRPRPGLRPGGSGDDEFFPWSRAAGDQAAPSKRLKNVSSRPESRPVQKTQVPDGPPARTLTRGGRDKRGRADPPGPVRVGLPDEDPGTRFDQGRSRRSRAGSRDRNRSPGTARSPRPRR